MHTFNLWDIALTITTALIIWWVQRVVSKFDGFEKKISRLEGDLRHNTQAGAANLKAILERMDLLFTPIKETLQRIEREVENLRNKNP
ncbi:MAG: hypothetical protein H7246_07730 [Phycisphaerae bacterium]|nr:hypothetical protein [Saprospiraceae bacterium]